MLFPSFEYFATTCYDYFYSETNLNCDKWVQQNRKVLLEAYEKIKEADQILKKIHKSQSNND